ncbi:MAG: hypothetical protein ABMA15_12210 [Vicinamibacterales bacterium]
MMRLRNFPIARVVRGLVLSVIAAGVLMVSVAGQTPTGAFTRTADGKPNLSGIWQAMNTANWDLQAHEAKMGPVVSLAAAFSVPPGTGVVEGNEIPYLPEALKKKQANGANWMALDPEVKCYMAGIPRATYQPFPFQILQSTNTIIMSYEFTSASRIIRMGTKEKSPAPAWMGWNIGSWDGDTLVIDVTDQMEETWFDRAGNFHSDALHVVERISPIDANTLKYEATIEDPKTFSRPWKISMPLYRRREPNAQLMEYKCVPFAEELMYGHLRKKPTR